MTKVARCCLLALAGFSSTAAHADFLIKPDPAAGQRQVSGQSQVAAGVVADEPHVDLADESPAMAANKAVQRPRLVAGFGDQVPLSFACRQIVPKIYKVGYGPGVSSGTLVDWKGGQTWRQVLGRAIKPLGLHIVWVEMKLEIRR